MSFNNTIYPVFDFAGYALAVAQSRAEIVRHSFIVDPHDRFPAFGSTFSLIVQQVPPS